MATSAGAVLVDFEAACIGPVEWDYSSLDGTVAAAADVSLDRDLLDVLRAWRSLTVSVWCWSQLGRAPEVDEAACWHLDQLHQRLDR